MKEEFKEIANKIRSLRKKYKMTLHEFAEYIDSEPSTISRYERGERIPKADFLIKLRAKTGCDLNDLLASDVDKVRSRTTRYSSHVNIFTSPLLGLYGTYKAFRYSSGDMLPELSAGTIVVFREGPLGKAKQCVLRRDQYSLLVRNCFYRDNGKMILRDGRGVTCPKEIRDLEIVGPVVAIIECKKLGNYY